MYNRIMRSTNDTRFEKHICYGSLTYKPRTMMLHKNTTDTYMRPCLFLHI